MTAGIGRRQFVAALGGLISWAFAAQAQQSGKVPQVGFLYPGLSTSVATRIAALREGLQASAYADADRVDILERSSNGDATKLAPFAADLVSRKVDVIVAVSPAAVRAAKAVTSDIPIVVGDLESDPVGAGFVASLAHPGGNITGVFSDFPDFAMKWLELLKETIPALSHAVVLWDPATGSLQLDAVKAAGKALNVATDVVEIRAIAALQDAFATAAARKPDAVIMLSSPIFGTDPMRIAELALSHRIPTATLFPEIARAGGLMAYGPNLLGTFRQEGTMVGKVLQGVAGRASDQVRNRGEPQDSQGARVESADLGPPARRRSDRVTGLLMAPVSPVRRVPLVILLPISAAAAFWPGDTRSGGAAPSFDCSHASSAVEREICRKDQLVGFDRQIAALYMQALGLLAAADADALREDRRLWLKLRGDCGTLVRGKPNISSDVEGCLADRMATRLWELQKVAADKKFSRAEPPQ